MSELEPGTVLGQRFRIETRLGHGSFGVVYRAHDLMVSMDVALKVLHPAQLSARRLERVKQEIQVARQAKSPHLVQIYDFTAVDGPTDSSLLVIAMELVDGSDLQSVMEREQPLPLRRTVELCRGILRCLVDLHALGVLHRDIKPANILVSPGDDVKLTDFGLALHLLQESRLTTTETPVGTAAYLFPETGDDVGPASDLYSLGVVVFEMLTGQRPFSGRGTQELLKAHLRETPPNVHQLRPEVPDALAAWVQRLLAKRPEQRYVSAAGALEALDRSATRRTLPASSVTGWRWRPLWGGIALLLLLVAIQLDNQGTRRRVGWGPAARPRLAHLGIPSSGKVIEAYSTTGELLWRRERVDGVAIPVRFRRDSSLDVAIVAFSADVLDPTPRHRVRLLDGATGRELTHYDLDSIQREHFLSRGFSDEFHPVLRAFDVDGDDLDELFITYIHRRYWPSYTIYCELQSHRNLSILVASGHHHLGTIADLDDDGLPEALFVGINNLLGFRTSVAAVKLPLVHDFRATWFPAFTPDTRYLGHNDALLWYALLPGSARNEAGHLRIDIERQRLRLPNELGGSDFVLDFHGLRLDSDTGLPRDSAPASEPPGWRRRAYARYRRIMALRQVENYGAELDNAFMAATSAARIAGEEELNHWLDIVWGQILVETGQFDGAQQWFEEVSGTLKNDLARGDEVAFQAGKAFHLAGFPGRAIDWYRQMIETAKPQTIGRDHWEALQKQILAHMELGQISRAQAAFERYNRRFPEQRSSNEIYLAYLRWLSGGPAQIVEVGPHDRDLVRYWALELRREAGEPAKTLLDAVHEDLKRASETRPLLHALEAELLTALGRSKEARQAASRACSALVAPHPDPIVVRHHTPDVRRRCNCPPDRALPTAR